jgi:hypothetical protein
MCDLFSVIINVIEVAVGTYLVEFVNLRCGSSLLFFVYELV